MSATLDLRKLPSLKRERVTFYDEDDNPIDFRLKSKDDLDEHAQRYLFGEIVVRDADDAMIESINRLKFMFFDDIPVEYLQGLTVRQKEEIQNFFIRTIGKPIHEVSRTEQTNVRVDTSKPPAKIQ